MTKPASNPRSLWKVLQVGAPRNFKVAGVWLLYTCIGIGLSLIVGMAINLSTSGSLNSPSLIRHGELFAVSASLLLGAMRLVSKDDGLEAFSGRQVISALVFGTGLISEIGYVLLRLVDSHAVNGKIAHSVAGSSIIVSGFVVLLVFVITMLDASRFPLDQALKDIENDYKKLSKKLGDLQ